jgi:hypothetical protein
VQLCRSHASGSVDGGEGSGSGDGGSSDEDSWGARYGGYVGRADRH